MSLPDEITITDRQGLMLNVTLDDEHNIVIRSTNPDVEVDIVMDTDEATHLGTKLIQISAIVDTFTSAEESSLIERK